MERRHGERKSVSFQAEIISSNKSYMGIIGNVSENGVYMKTNPTNADINLLPTTPIEIKFHTSSDETLNLDCEIIWLYTKKIPQRNSENDSLLENNIGMEIKKYTPEYEKFVMNL
jgi:hypothetical protein